MKKKFLMFCLFIFISLCFLFCSKVIDITPKKETDVFYLNAYDDISYSNLQKLASSIQKEGISVNLSDKNHFQSGLINIYATSDIKNLPPVLDESAINFLWIPKVTSNIMEQLRSYDVIVVKTMPSFYHLKAINVRTAYIPDAVNITAEKFPAFSHEYPMYYGDNDLGFSLALYLAGPTDLKIDIYGKGFSGLWTESDIMKEPAKNDDFTRYPLILADQADEDIKDEILSQRLIKIIENGGLPYIRYNAGVEKMFGDIIPMYHTDTAFLPEIKRLLASPEDIAERRISLLKASKQWNSSSQAKKFIELATIMKQKMQAAKE